MSCSVEGNLTISLVSNENQFNYRHFLLSNIIHTFQIKKITYHSSPTPLLKNYS